ncbi:energy transducer TonB [Flavobacterium sp.]|jgi:protein TonB|uniref:energy transducer TonB n=1 Tax=Flavobacterium sp. TaxID=239 RepID=UPI0037C1A8E1
MSNLSIFEKKWIDLVFEGKNKAYGAYQLRQESSKTTVLAFISGISFIVVVSGIGLFLSSFGAKPKMNPDIPVIDSLVITPYHRDPEIVKPLVQPPASSAPDVEVPKNKNFVAAPTDQSETDVPTTSELPTTNTPTGIPGGTGTNPNPSTGVGTTPEPEVKLPEGPTVTAALDEQPDFPGGIDRFRKQVGEKFNTPELDEVVVVSVIVSFVIEKDGTMTDIKVLKNPGYDLDKEAIRVLKSIKTKWKPGKIKGQLMRTQYTLPIKVQLN